MKSAWRLSRAVRPCSCLTSSFRSFSNSAIHRVYLPVFPSTSSPDLDNIIKVIQDRILVPAHLNRAQRRLVNDPSRAEYLANEEVIIKIGQVDVRLQHEDLSKNRQMQTEAFREALRHTEASGDWDIWLDLLKAYHSANITLGYISRVKFVRKAIEAGRLDLVIRVLAQAGETGFSLATPEIRDLVFFGLREQASKAEWDTAIMKSSLRQAEKLLMMMETLAHANREQMAPLLPIAVALELSYRLQYAPKIEQEDGETESKTEFVPLGYLEKTKKFAKRMLSFPDFISLANEKNSFSSEQVSNLSGNLVPHGFIAVVCGLQAAEKVLDDADKAAVQRALSSVEHALDNYKDAQQIYQAQRLDAST